MERIVLTLQLICIALTGVGIGIEIRFHADVGYLLITAGGVIFAVSEKIAKYSLRKENRKLRNMSSDEGKKGGTEK